MIINNGMKLLVSLSCTMCPELVTADQIYTFVIEKYPSIGRETVYRNLGILVEEGKVRRKK